MKFSAEKVMSQSSKSGNQATSFASLSDILANSSSTKRTTRSSIRASAAAASASGTSLLPTLEDLKQKLEGSHDDTCTKLNLSRAFGGLPSSFRFESTNLNNHDEQSSLLESTSNNHQELNNINNNLNVGRQKRQQFKREQRGSQNVIKTETSIGANVYDDTQREIAHIIKKIELNKHLNFKDNDSDDKDQIKLLPEFNLIQLPADFNLEHGQINVYQSGIIEIISGDQPPVKFRMRRAAKRIDESLTTDLILTTENQAIIERMNVCVPETVPNELNKSPNS
ncbi:hypothetical protein DERP_001824 [Dermatophagoides pteronyssinus]|uniref:Uncharacterized protein n=1 Tax=Dermatophagoides pteronyssinus TaxID=6956 RepID=A0ABQ8JBK4_DERPT|nr:hypothetical protein DERP_001824 [Dermatophagoides pteronyssinus]